MLVQCQPKLDTLQEKVRKMLDVFLETVKKMFFNFGSPEDPEDSSLPSCTTEDRSNMTLTL